MHNRLLYSILWIQDLWPGKQNPFWPLKKNTTICILNYGDKLQTMLELQSSRWTLRDDIQLIDSRFSWKISFPVLPFLAIAESLIYKESLLLLHGMDLRTLCVIDAFPWNGSNPR